jgi:hypothetical protein
MLVFDFKKELRYWAILFVDLRGRVEKLSDCFFTCTTLIPADKSHLTLTVF